MTTPGGFRPFYTSSFGISWSRRRNEDGSYDYAAHDDAQAVVDQNKRLANHGRHHNAEKDRYLAASLPMILWLKWKNEEGWDAFDPNHAEKLRQKLNDPDYEHLRIWKGRL